MASAPSVPSCEDLENEFVSTKFPPFSTVPNHVLEYMFGVSSLSNDSERRSTLLIDYLKNRKISLQSALRIYHKAKRMFFDDLKNRKKARNSIRALLQATPVRPPHKRNLTKQEMNVWITHLKSDQNTRTEILSLAVLVSIYTGFRMITLSNLKTSHLVAMLNKSRTISMRSKGGFLNFQLVYFDDLMRILFRVNALIVDQMEMFRLDGIDTFVFGSTTCGGSVRVVPRLIANHINTAFVTAFRKPRPYGFGLHSCRYYIASELKRKGLITEAQSLLGHKSLKTTQKYTKEYALDEVQNKFTAK